MRIVLVEDEDITREVVVSTLERHGHTVLAFANGTDAVDHLEGAVDKPQLLITDIALPDDFDGWSLARAYQEKFPRLPVIYITASRGPEDPVNNSVYLRKPIKPDLLARAVKAFGL